jgi:fluoride exporter
VDHDDHLPIDPDLAPTDPAEPALDRPHPSTHVHRSDPRVLAVIALGGMLGASARYGVNRWLPTSPGTFPWATFWENVVGSFLLGLVLVVVLERLAPSRWLRPFLATGVLGAFTTMSTYQVETALLLKDGHAATAVAYLFGSVVAGLALAFAGLRAGRRIALPRPVG